MADNVDITEGSGKVIGGDDISSVIYQRIKLIHGADGTNDGDISTANPFPVELTDNNQTVVADIGNMLTALQLIDNPVKVLGTATYTEGGTSGNVIGVVRNDTLATLVNTDNEIAPLQVNSDGALYAEISSALPAGTNNIGDVDIVTIPDAVVDTNYFTATITSADASSATQIKAKTAAKKIYVTSLMISVGSTAIEVQLQSDNGSPQVVMEEIFLAANGGLTLTASSDKMPLFIVDTNEDLDVITSAAGDITILVSGYVV